MPVLDGAHHTANYITTSLIPPKPETNKKTLSGAGVPCYNQNQGVGTKPTAWVPWPGAITWSCPGEDQASPPIPHTRQSCPLSSWTGWILPSPDLAQMVASGRAHSLPTPQALLMPGTQSWLRWETEARTHFTSEPWSCMMSMMIDADGVRWASRRFHSFLLPHRPWENRSCWRRVCENHSFPEHLLPAVTLWAPSIL